MPQPLPLCKFLWKDILCSLTATIAILLQLITCSNVYITVLLYLEPNSAPKNAGIVQNSVSTQRVAPLKAATLEAVSDLNVHCKL